MCLKIKSGPHIAESDFYVVKMCKGVTQNSGKSPYRNFLYKFNEVYLSDIEEENDEIEEGIHCLVVSELLGSGWVLHGVNYDSHGYAGLGSDGDFILCKVTSGTLYYIGNDGDIVVSRIIPESNLSDQLGVKRTGQHFTMDYVNRVKEYLESSSLNILLS